MASHRKLKCKTGKAIFTDKSKAEEFCNGKKLRSYKCDDCGYHHVTSEVFEETNIKLTYYNNFKKYLAKK